MKNLSFTGWMYTLLSASILFCEQTQAKKNILLLISDDFNYWTNGYYPQIKTPYIDSLGKKGVFFYDVSSSSPVCNPSRNAFMSGLMPATTGIIDNGSGHIRDAEIADSLPYLRTMNEHFTQNGYYTYAGGKVYHPTSMNKGDADQDNWSSYSTLGTGATGGNFYQWSGNGRVAWSAGEYDLDVEENAMDRDLAKHFADKITNYNDDKPFFFACGFFRPHLEWHVHKQYFDRFNLEDLSIPQGYKEDDLDDVNESANDEFNEITNEGKELEAIRAYLACLAFTDDNVGIVLEALNNSAHKDSTIVVFFGDHGWHLGEKDRYRKATPWDMAFRTTLIIYDPTMPGNGKVCNKVVSLMDIYPTLVELTGIEYNYQIEGRSIRPLLYNPEDADWDHPIVMFRGNTPIIKTNKWRYVQGKMLYDIENDPYEWYNLYNDSNYNDVMSDLDAQIATLLDLGQSVKTGGVNNAVKTEINDTFLILNKATTVTMQVSPNPAYTELNISITLSKAEYTLLSLTGSVVAKGVIRNGKTKIDVSELTQGTYVLSVRAGSTLLNKKINVLVH